MDGNNFEIGETLHMCNYNNQGYILFGDNASIHGNSSNDTLRLEALNGVTLHSSGGISLNTSGNGEVTVNGNKLVTQNQMESWVQQYVAYALSQL